MPKRIKDGGTNAAALAGNVNTGQVARESNPESPTTLNSSAPGVPEPRRMSQALSAKMEEIRRLSDYREDVYSHFTMNEVAASTKALYPTAQTMVFDIEDEGAYMTKLVLKDGSEVEIDPSSELNDDLFDATWENDMTYKACGYSDPRYAYINVDDALDVPEFLTDPSFLDAPPVPSTGNIRPGYKNIHSLAELDYAARGPRFPEVDQKIYDEQDAELEIRRAELKAAGVTR